MKKIVACARVTNLKEPRVCYFSNFCVSQIKEHKVVVFNTKQTTQKTCKNFSNCKLKTLSVLIGILILKS